MTLNVRASGVGEPEVVNMQQSLSVITIGMTVPVRSRRFYVEGFGWTPAFESDEIIFYQMNGFVLGTFLRSALETDMNRPAGNAPGAYALAHNVASQADVVPVMDRLIAAGGTLLRPADAPPHGGFRGYVADPDGHAWEIMKVPAGDGQRLAQGEAQRSPGTGGKMCQAPEGWRFEFRKGEARAEACSIPVLFSG